MGFVCGHERDARASEGKQIIPKYKTNFPLSQLLKSVVVAVGGSAFIDIDIFLYIIPILIFLKMGFQFLPF